MSIQIIKVEGDELYLCYPGQTKAQPCYVELDCYKATLSAEPNTEIGNAVPLDVHHGHRIRWTIPALKARRANELLSEIAPLAERVVAGYYKVWNGSNTVAEYNDDASEAIREIEREIQLWDTTDCRLSVLDASTYYEPLGSKLVQARELGITAETTDEQLDAIAERELDNADDVNVIEGHVDYLKRLREAAADLA